MKLARAVVFTVSLVLLGAGYALSQQAFFQSPLVYSDFLVQVDTPIVRISALALLAVCVVLPLLGKAEESAAK